MAYTVYELARLAHAVYDESRSEVDGWARARVFGNSAQGFYAALFQQEERWVFAIRGTDDLYDSIPDFEIFAALIPVQLAEAQSALTASLRLARKQKLVLTGHSLGGGLAALLAYHHGRCAVTFNAPGVARSYANAIAVISGPGLIENAANELLGTYMGLMSMGDNRIINIRAHFDIVSKGTGLQLGSVDSIGVSGCTPTWDEFGARLEQLPMDMIMNRPSGQFDPFGGMIFEATFYVLCQHRMELMERQLSTMAAYKNDLGW